MAKVPSKVFSRFALRLKIRFRGFNRINEMKANGGIPVAYLKAQNNAIQE